MLHDCVLVQLILNQLYTLLTITKSIKATMFATIMKATCKLSNIISQQQRREMKTSITLHNPVVSDSMIVMETDNKRTQ